MTYELDHPGFIIRDSKGLQMVVYGIQRGLGMEVFPVDLIYRPWKHAEGQVGRMGQVYVNDKTLNTCLISRGNKLLHSHQ